MILSDPSEAIESDQIQDALKAQFSELEYHGLGGNILHLLLKDIAHHYTTDNEEAAEYLEKFIRKEDEFLNNGNKSDFIFGIYSK